MRACLNGSKSEFSQIIKNDLGSVFYIHISYYDYDSYCVWIKYAVIYVNIYILTLLMSIMMSSLIL